MRDENTVSFKTIQYSIPVQMQLYSILLKIIMKNRVIYLLLWFSCYFSYSHAQNMLQQGNQWVFEDRIFSNLLFSYIDTTIETISVDGDTAINNNSYTRLILSTVPGCWNVNAKEYLRVDGNKIFRLSQDFQQEFLMIDFDETVGYEMLYDNGVGIIDTGLVVIDSFGIEDAYDGTPIEVQYVKIINNQSFDDSVTYKVYKGIGFLDGGLLFPFLGAGLCDFGDWTILHCFLTGSDTIHFTEYGCFEIPIINSTQEAKQNEVNLFPNPTFEKVKMPEGMRLLEVTNMNGQQIFPEYNENYINLDGFPSGQYIFRFKSLSGNEIWISRVEKI